ncbi:oocyte-secreted protein 2-like [Sarcophilus harrisii]|uniref:oocyte-secreted protein 2-like n=1 Tax=Sarcophilus harrisii TaxID=9305 RepID=UPI001301DCAB|nr:oocyte-secreted protein 2-like [Sarcophilus harrisii]
MNSFLKLKVLCVLVFQAWTQCFPVRTECSLHILQVFVKKLMFNDGVWVSSNDLTMGNDCPVNHMKEFEFEFHYSVTECGIETKVYATAVLFQAVVHYNPQHPALSEFNHSKTDFYVSCVVSRIVKPQYSLWPPEQDPEYSASFNPLLLSSPKFCSSPKDSTSEDIKPSY